MTSWSSSIKIWFLQAYSMHYLKKMSWCDRNAKIYAIGETECKVFILGGQRIDQKRNKGWWRGSRQRIEMEAQKVTELTIEEEDKEHLHLPLLVSSRCVSSEFLTRFCSKALQQ